ncbi:glycosyltransferase [Leptolyngbyaceae cyanobacterium JSC-12]|nr:glycosyltransferase [Leptolyngbyaceae cyanobacterium JSC-12]
MRILFLDQSGKPGGAELCLLDVAKPYRDRCLVGLLADGPFRELLEQQSIPVKVLTQQSIQVQKNSHILQGVLSLQSLIAPITKAIELSRECDLIYANTQKALVVGAIASILSRRPLVYHLHDIVSPEHFSASNRQIITTLANRVATWVIANSHASQAAFIQAGGRPEKTTVIYNGFDPVPYQAASIQRERIRQELGICDRFVVGHFSRLSPWKGQHILIEALAQCPANVIALFVGDALFGEEAYVKQLYHQVNQLGLQERIQFLGFRSDIPALMSACDLVAHTSTAPEPFGRVIIEAMLCGRPVVAAAAGGAVELVQPGETGWLVPPGDSLKLAEVIHQVQTNPARSQQIAQQAQRQASQQFNLASTNHQIAELLQAIVKPSLIKSCSNTPPG